MHALFVMGRGPGGRPHFHLLGIPIRVELSFLIMGVLLGQGFPPADILLWFGCLFVSILVHEMGHALMYRAFGARTQITLYAMGGLTFGTREKPFRTGERVVVSLSGPAFGLVLGFAVWAAASFWGPAETPAINTAVMMLKWINIGWGFFNLLPIIPMDGGHVMEAILSHRKPVRGRIWARYITIVLCCGLGFLAFEKQETWIAFLMVMFAVQAFQGLMVLRQTATQPITPASPPPESEGVTEDLERLRGLMQSELPREARAVAFQILDRASTAASKDAALRALAWLAITDGEPQQALGYLGKTSRGFDDPFLWGTAIAASGDAPNALPHLSRAFAQHPDPQVIAAYARCLVAVGRRGEALALARDDAPTDQQRALAEALFRSRDYEGAAQVSERLFAARGMSEDAYNAACARARRGESESAIRWLQRAEAAGFHDGAHLAADPDFEALRERPDFRELLSRLPPPAPIAS